jgi:hypothetical protein
VHLFSTMDDEEFNVYDDINFETTQDDATAVDYSENQDDTFNLYDDVAAEASGDKTPSQEPSESTTAQEEREGGTPANSTPPTNAQTTDHHHQQHQQQLTTGQWDAAHPDQTALYVGNLRWWTTDQQLEDLFGQYGKIKSLRIADDRVNGKSKGYAMIEFYSAEAARLAKENIHGKDLDGKECIINFVSETKQFNASNAGPATGMGMGRGMPPMGRGMAPKLPMGSTKPFQSQQPATQAQQQAQQQGQPMGQKPLKPFPPKPFGGRGRGFFENMMAAGRMGLARGFPNPMHYNPDMLAGGMNPDMMPMMGRPPMPPVPRPKRQYGVAPHVNPAFLYPPDGPPHRMPPDMMYGRPHDSEDWESMPPPDRRDPDIQEMERRDRDRRDDRRDDRDRERRDRSASSHEDDHHHHRHERSHSSSSSSSSSRSKRDRDEPSSSSSTSSSSSSSKYAKEKEDDRPRSKHHKESSSSSSSSSSHRRS